MDQPNYTADNIKNAVNQWLFQDAVDIEKEKAELKDEREQLEAERKRIEDERRALEDEKRKIDLERDDLKRRTEIENARLERENSLFEMKWRLMEEEIVRLEKEKLEVAQLREEYTPTVSIQGLEYRSSVLFSGVSNELELKKRYKDLMKIFHPDNVAGDDATVCKINDEYEQLKNEFRARY